MSLPAVGDAAAAAPAIVGDAVTAAAASDAAYNGSPVDGDAGAIMALPVSRSLPSREVDREACRRALAAETGARCDAGEAAAAAAGDKAPELPTWLGEGSSSGRCAERGIEEGAKASGGGMRDGGNWGC